MSKKSNENSFFISPYNVRIECDGKSSLLQLILKEGLEINHSCGGHGACGTCRVIVEEIKAKLPPRSELEQERADERGFTDLERLACQLLACPGIKIRLP